MISDAAHKVRTIFDHLADDLADIVAKLQGIPSGVYYLLVLTVVSISWAASCMVPEASGIMVIVLALLFILLIWIKE